MMKVLPQDGQRESGQAGYLARRTHFATRRTIPNRTFQSASYEQIRKSAWVELLGTISQIEIKSNPKILSSLSFSLCFFSTTRVVTRDWHTISAIETIIHSMRSVFSESKIHQSNVTQQPASISAPQEFYSGYQRCMCSSLPLP